MPISRTDQASLHAVAAAPGLDQLAAVIEPFAGSPERANAFIWFLGAQWPISSRSELSDLVKDPHLWRELRATAERYGRPLPTKPFNDSRFTRIRTAAQEAGADLGSLVAAALPASTMAIADAIGMLPSDPPTLLCPDRHNTLLGDGTVIRSPTEVYEDADGRPVGSKAKTRAAAHTSPKYYGKTDTEGRSGFPLATISSHGEERWDRMVFAVGFYDDRNEIGCSMNLFRQVHDVFGDRVHAFAYDGLMKGVHQRALMRAGVVPIVEMPSASKTDAHLLIPSDERWRRCVEPWNKSLAQLHNLGEVTHSTASGTCHHQLWSVDGALVATERGRYPTIATPTAPTLDLAFAPGSRSWKSLIASYLLACEHGDFVHTIDLTGKRADGKLYTNALRAISWAEHLPDVRYFRNDVESTIATLQNYLPDGRRAWSHDPLEFLLDAVGFAIWTNSTAWDIAAGQVTHNSLDCRFYLDRKRERDPRLDRKYAGL